MTDIEKQALALVNEVLAERVDWQMTGTRADNASIEAICRAIEQLEAYKREVSDAAINAISLIVSDDPTAQAVKAQLSSFIHRKPVDPLVGVAREMTLLDGIVRTDSQKAAIREGRAGRTASDGLHARLRAALAPRGGKIVWGEGE